MPRVECCPYCPRRTGVTAAVLIVVRIFGHTAAEAVKYVFNLLRYFFVVRIRHT